MAQPSSTTGPHGPAAAPSDSPDTRPKRDHHGFRGVPPPPKFDLDELPDSALLDECEIAAILRNAVVTVQTWRRRQHHPLKWIVIGGGRIRYRVGDLRDYLASGGNRGQPRKSAIVPKRYVPPPPRRRGQPRKPRAQPRLA